MTEPTPIFAEIQALLDRDTSAPLDDLEHTLTAGYAAALSLEAERWRLQRRMDEVTGELGAGKAGRESEVGHLARELTSTDDELTRLRSLLRTLRDRAATVRGVDLHSAESA